MALGLKTGGDEGGVLLAESVRGVFLGFLMHLENNNVVEQQLCFRLTSNNSKSKFFLKKLDSSQIAMTKPRNREMTGLLLKK